MKAWPSWRMPYWMRLIVSLALVVLCIRLVDPHRLISAAAQVSPIELVAALSLNFLGTVFCRAWSSWVVNNESGVAIPLTGFLKINLIARFYTLTMPRGAAAVVRWDAYRRGSSGASATALLAFETLVTLLILFFTAGLFLAVAPPQDSAITRSLEITIWLGTFALVGSMLPFFNAKAANIAQNIADNLARRWPRLETGLSAFVESVRRYKSIPAATAGQVLMINAVGYAAFVLSAWVITCALELDLTLLQVGWIRSLTMLATLVPVTVAGIGMREAVFIILMGECGVEPPAALAFSLIAFSLQISLGIIGGGLELKRWLQR